MEITSWRPPSDEEIVSIINNFVQEEILYEALLLILDQEDRIIKRRLAQKITFLKQETIPDEPSEEELQDFLNKIKMITMFQQLTLSHITIFLKNLMQQAQKLLMLTKQMELK